MSHSRRASKRWIAGMSVLLFIVPVLAWKILPPRTPNYIIEDFIPEHMSFALHVHDLHDTWKNHWLNRDTTSTRALIKILEAAGVWAEWQEEYGDSGLQMKLGLLEEILGRNIDREAWMFFGAWGASQKEYSGNVGLVIVLESDGPIGKRIVPILEYAVDDFRFTTSAHHNFKLYDLEPEGWDGDHLVFFHAGKWIVGVLQTQNMGPLDQILERLDNAPLSLAQTEDFREFFRVSGAQSPIEAIFHPEQFWAQFRVFYAQREKRLSSDSEDLLQYWQQRLEGVKWVHLSHRGPHLLDLDMDITGPRPTLFAKNLRERVELISGVISKDPPPLAGDLESNSCDVAQIDLSLPMARMIMPLTGFSWDLVLEDIEYMDLAESRLLELPKDLLANDERLDSQRVGLTAYHTAVGWMPAVGFWADRRPSPDPKRPASHWIDSAATPTAEMVWMSPMGVRPGPQACVEWKDFVSEVWGLGGRTPDGFAAVNFEAVARMMNSFPIIMIPDEEFREEWSQTLKIAEIVALGIGEIVVRLDIDETQWTLQSYAC